MSQTKEIARTGAEPPDGAGNAGAKSEEARQRLRKRVDALLGECGKIAGQKRAASAPPAGTPLPAAAAAPPPAPPAQGGHRAMVVEGNPLHRKVLVRALEQSGYEVDVLESAAEAVEVFQRRPYGIVLIDCDTPDIDGYRTAASLRMIEGAERHTPIVGLTGNAGQAHRRERKAAGIDNYLLKPFRRERVESVVARYAPTRGQTPDAQLMALDKDRVRELQELAGGDAALLQELVDLFLSSAPDLLSQMRRAAEDGDDAGLRRAAHTLKGSSGQMGALRMQELCATIETLAASGALAAVDPFLAEVSLAFERSVAELRALRNSFPGSGAEAGERPSKAAPKSNDILLAEDDPLIAKFLSASLTGAGFHVTHAQNGQEAMEALRGKSFAVVILDINMPEVDGYQVLSEIRATVGESTPVAIISSRHQEQDILRAFDLGVDDYLTKPFNPSEVVARVRRLARYAAARP